MTDQQTTTMSPQDIVKMTDERLAQWDVMGMDHEAQVEWARTEIPRKMADIFKANDQPLQLVVHERLLDAVTEGLKDVVVPDDVKTSPDDDGQQFKDFCRAFPVRSARTEEMAIPPHVQQQIPAEDQFTVFLTLQGQQINYLRAFDQKLGISQYLMENKIPLALNQEDLLTMVKFFVLLQCINRAAQQQVVPATAQDLSHQIFRP